MGTSWTAGIQGGRDRRAEAVPAAVEAETGGEAYATTGGTVVYFGLLWDPQSYTWYMPTSANSVAPSGSDNTYLFLFFLKKKLINCFLFEATYQRLMQILPCLICYVQNVYK